VPDDDRLTLTLVDPSPDADGDGDGGGGGDLAREAYLLHRRDPRVPLQPAPRGELRVIPWDVATTAFADLLEAAPTAVIVTADRDDRLLQLSMDVTATLPAGAALWLCAEQSGGLVDIASGRNPRSSGRPVQVFHAFDTVLEEDGILRGVDEELARAVHQAHRLYRTNGPIHDDDVASTVPWDRLPPELRSLNELAVATWRQVLVDEGYRIVPYTELRAETAALPPQLVETLAVAIHQAWSQGKKAQGYKRGVRRNDDPTKGPLTHPEIDVPFDDQPYESQEWSRSQARAVPGHLAAAGLQLEAPRTSAPPPAAADVHRPAKQEPHRP